MKPIIILPPNTMSAEHQQMLRDNEICVVEAKEPLVVKFVDPIPSAKDRGKVEQAAIKLSRILLNRQWSHVSADNTIGLNTISRLYVECLIEGTELDRSGSVAEQEQQIYNIAKANELRRLAREEAKVERAAAKAAKK